jgi:hypothetical protein
MKDAVFDRFSLFSSVEAAINMYFTSPDEIPTLFPPQTTSTSIDNNLTSGSESGATDNTELCLSCGHVAENLTPSSLDELIVGMNAVRQGLILPSHICDSDYGEYTIGSFLLILPLKHNF